ncbi:DHH family phosphoesterase [Lagierella sp.]|uniref:DHH family phosphoesterase n=1 Tax=Lagierella sp. TaxID=2849657 RepID=UPI002632B1BB|nr:DHH family phosphoesterase [Lagierella sp.]
MKKFNIYNLADKVPFYIFMIICSVTIFYYNRVFGVIAFAITGFLAFYEVRSLSEKKEELEEYMENFNEKFDEVTRRAIFSMPFPLVILNDGGKIIWHNSNFKNLIDEEEPTLNLEISEVFPEVNMESLPEDNQFIPIEYKGDFYRMFINTFVDSKAEKNVLLYIVEYTNEKNLENLLLDESISVINLNVDNYDELSENTDDTNRPMVFAKIDSIINNFASEHEGFAIKYEQEDYTIVMSYENLLKAIKSKFYILDEVREIEEGNRIPATLSIGVGTLEKNPLEAHKSARACLNIALGRGGDQAVVKMEDHFEYFGGKNQSVSKNSTVKARVMANGLIKLLERSGDVFIMGHKNPDMDSLGSCLGVMELAKKLNKNFYIVLKEITPAIEKIYNSLMKNYPNTEDFNIKDIFIKPSDAVDLCKNDSVVVVLDHHRKTSSEAPKLLEISKNIILIDHHRRSSDYIDNAILTYLEPHASSTSELITEILFYSSDRMKIPKVIAEALLAGITVDTKNFILQTGVRTFEAASILKRQGADSIKVRQLFRNDISTVRQKGEVVYKAEIYRDRIAIGTLEEVSDDNILIAAQAADELLNMNNIEAAFVATKLKNKIHISGRSLGDISVQLILEKLDGGGHLTSAGTQMDIPMKEAVEELKKVIDEYLQEDKDESNTDR